MGTASNLFFCHREFGAGPTPTDEPREYLLFYVHILFSKINMMTVCFGLPVTPEPIKKFLARVA